MSGNGLQATAIPAQAGLTASADARAIVRLIQCSQCSYPFRHPLTLACGNTLCRECIPPLHKRENITYPAGQGRSEGFICPFTDCGTEHVPGDCSVDVILNKLVEVFKAQVATYRTETAKNPLALDERLHWPSVVNSSIDIMPRSRVLNGGKLLATFTFAEMGELNYHSEVAYTPVHNDQDDSADVLDVAVLENWKEVARSELECQVCYALMLEPLTSTCGHTFCRKCVARVLDHATQCPACRRPLLFAPGVKSEPGNKRLSLVIESFWSDVIAERMAASALEEAVDEMANLPLFPCTLAFPHMPTFLHIFEPRYRLMIRRAMENGSRKFGILMYNSRRTLQGTLGYVDYMQYGTTLYIERVEMLPDGRSVIETRGVSRFRVLETRQVDGYLVGRVQRIDDIPLTDEEVAEAQETNPEQPPATDAQTQIDRMSTQRLLQFGLDFITAAQSRSARWLHQRVLAAYGQAPADPAMFPYWFASILPIAEEEKYCLLPTTSVRERLKITARWIQRLEAARCSSPDNRFRSAYEEEVRAMMAQQAIRLRTATAAAPTAQRHNDSDQSDGHRTDSEGDGEQDTATSQSHEQGPDN